jgi:t-SNARE complex subunit (syntaxin)
MSFEDHFSGGNSGFTRGVGYEGRGFNSSSGFYSGGTSSEVSYQQDNLFSTPSDYDNNFQAVSNSIRQISTYVEQIRQLTSKVGTTRDTPEVREGLQQLIESTRKLVKSTSQDLKALNTSSSKNHVLQQKLLKDLQTWVTKFQEINKIAVEKERANPVPITTKQQQQLVTTSRSGSSFPGVILDLDLESQTTSSEITKNQQLQLQNEASFNEALIVDRDQSIREIEKTVVELNDIFKDLSSLVSEQGSMLDNIESNIDVSVQQVSKGTEQLRKASDYQKKARTKMCCLFLLLSVILGVVVLVIYLFVAK